MSKCKDLRGQKFGKLTVLCRLYNTKGHKTYWLCVCDCGNLAEVRSDSLYNGNTKGCGCLNHDPKNIHHGKYCTRLYRIYYNIKKRCYNHKDENIYNYYGGRGITMCDEWKNDFMTFYNWAMNNGYTNSLTIDRIDNNGKYEPSNCRWITMKQQGRNKRNNKVYTIKGKTRCLSEWCEILGLKYQCVWKRLNRGWSIEKALALRGLH